MKPLGKPCKVHNPCPCCHWASDMEGYVYKGGWHRKKRKSHGDMAAIRQDKRRARRAARAEIYESLSEM